MTWRSPQPEQLTVAAVAATVVLALTVAVFAIDPGTIVDQPLLAGPERIAVVGLPLALLAALATSRLPAGLSRGGSSVLLGVFVAWLLVGSFFSPSPAISFAFAASFGCIAFAGRSLGRLSPSLLFSAMAFALPVYLSIAVLSRATGSLQPWFVLDRLTLISLEANQLARFAAVAGIAGLYLLVETSPSIVRAAGAAVALAGFGLIPRTDSRTGAAALAAALVVLLLLRGTRTAIAWISVAAVASIAVLVISPLGNPLTSDLSRAGTRGGASSLTGRTEIWPVVFDQALRQPVTGHGLGADRSLISGLSYTVGFEIQHAHNLLLHLFLTTGIIGTGLFVALIWRQFGSPGASVRTATNPWAVTLTVFVVLDGISEPVLQNPTASWLAIVAATVLTQQSPPIQPARRSADPRLDSDDSIPHDRQVPVTS